MKLFPHQKDALEKTTGLNRVAYFYDMGLGKTFIGSEKMISFDTKYNIVVCQKSKVKDWIDHFRNNYVNINVVDLTDKKNFDTFVLDVEVGFVSAVKQILIINYDLVFRRSALLKLNDVEFTLLLDESQLISNECAKRSKFILKMQPENVILLSGTPTSGKYERLWSQLHLIGWEISKKAYWNSYVITEWIEDGNTGFRREVVKGYKNTERLRRKLQQHGALFKKTEEVFDLPSQQDIVVNVPCSKEYYKFMRDYIVTVEDRELVGDQILTKMMCLRQLCGQYNKDKLEAFRDLIESTDDRVIVFYNFWDELWKMMKVAEEAGKPYSCVNGKGSDLKHYEECDNSITFVQYQAGAMGLNLQKAHITIYFTLPFGKGSCGLWEQSKARTNRIGQNEKCLYYYILCEKSIEGVNLNNLKEGKEYNDYLFEEYVENSVCCNNIHAND